MKIDEWAQVCVSIDIVGSHHEHFGAILVYAGQASR